MRQVFRDSSGLIVVHPSPAFAQKHQDLRVQEVGCRTQRGQKDEGLEERQFLVAATSVTTSPSTPVTGTRRGYWPDLITTHITGGNVRLHSRTSDRVMHGSRTGPGSSPEHVVNSVVIMDAGMGRIVLYVDDRVFVVAELSADSAAIDVVEAIVKPMENSSTRFEVVRRHFFLSLFDIIVEHNDRQVVLLRLC